MGVSKTKHEVVVYRGTTVPAMDVMVDGETVWLSIDQMASLFGRDSSVIGKHVRNVFSDEELDILPNRQNLPICGKVHPVSYYSLDVVFPSATASSRRAVTRSIRKYRVRRRPS